MVRFNQFLAAVLSVAMLGPMSPSAVAAAQEAPESLVTQVQIDEALRRAAAEEDASRNHIRELLTSESVRRLARSAGLDPDYVEKAAGSVDTLEGEDLERAAGYASELSDRLSGGDVTVSIGLVSLLLIIIIIILLAK
ncbi:MAG TPA: hypothetical protein VJ921_05955 [Vicinamibacteria bacterium]|nr:hypothetical protein [Vicinamibacteria bacterium]